MTVNGDNKKEKPGISAGGLRIVLNYFSTLWKIPIREKYKTLISETDFLKDFENISEVSLRAKGTVRGWHTIYSNPNTPIILPVYDAD